MKNNSAIETFSNVNGKSFLRNTSKTAWMVIDQSINDQREYEKCLADSTVVYIDRFESITDNYVELFKSYPSRGYQNSSNGIPCNNPLNIRKKYLEEAHGIGFDSIIQKPLNEQLLVCNDILNTVTEKPSIYREVFATQTACALPLFLLECDLTNTFEAFQSCLNHFSHGTLKEYLDENANMRSATEGRRLYEAARRIAWWLIKERKVLAPIHMSMRNFALIDPSTRRRFSKPIYAEIEKWACHKFGSDHNFAKSASSYLAWPLLTTTLYEPADLDKKVCDYLWDTSEELRRNHKDIVKVGLVSPRDQASLLYRYVQYEVDASVRLEDYSFNRSGCVPKVEQTYSVPQIQSIIDELKEAFINKYPEGIPHRIKAPLGGLAAYLQEVQSKGVALPSTVEELCMKGFVDGEPGCQNLIKFTEGNYSNAARYIAAIRQGFKLLYYDYMKQGKPTNIDWNFKYNLSTRRLTKTTRNPLPIRIINMMKEMILPGGISSYPDSEEGYNSLLANFTEELGYDDRFSKSLFVNRVRNIKTNRFEDNVFCPHIPALLYLLLTLPLRPIQARWLDSGDLDEYTYSFGQKRMVPNADGTPGRLTGCLQMSTDDFFGGEDTLGLFVNTNKTGNYRHDGKQSGYTVPYMSSELLHLFRYCIEWNKQYSFIEGETGHTVDLFANETVWKNRIEKETITMPKVTPIFRNYISNRSDTRAYPPPLNRLRDFYALLLARTELKLRDTKNDDLRLVDDALSRSPKGLIDFYSLRISGITNMFRAGVPIEVLSEFVAGHATFLMTLHYTKLSPYEVRGVIQKAQQSLAAESFDLDSIYERASFDADFFSDQFVHSANHSNEIMHYNFQESYKTRTVDVRIDGLCLSCKDCESGVIITTDKTGNVGHENCTDCQYWLTGPQFLLGQVLKCNQLMQVMINTANEVVELRKRENNALSSNEVSRSEYKAISGQLEKAEHQLSRMHQEWEVRTQLIYASYSLKGSDSNESTLISMDSPDSIQLNIKKAHDLEYLNLMSAAAEIYPEFRTERYDIKLEHIISRILASSNDVDTSLFLCLDDKTRKEASFAFSEMILNMFHSDDQSQQVENIEKAIGEGLPMELIPQISQQLSVFSESSKAKKELSDNGPLGLE